MHGKFELACQHGDWGYYAVVSLEVEVIKNGGGLAVVFRDNDSGWKDGVQFGIAYADEKFRLLQSESVATRVHVIEVEGHPVDTTTTVAAFVAAKAFFHAIGMAPPSGLRLVEESGEFIFPK